MLILLMNQTEKFNKISEVAWDIIFHVNVTNYLTERNSKKGYYSLKGLKD